eukprot:SAG11_NODE_704_length_7657_cov_38.765943_8_plen_114_part_00
MFVSTRGPWVLLSHFCRDPWVLLSHLSYWVSCSNSCARPRPGVCGGGPYLQVRPSGEESVRSRKRGGGGVFVVCDENNGGGGGGGGGKNFSANTPKKGRKKIVIFFLKTQNTP